MASRETKDIAIAWIALSVAFALAFSGLNLFGIISGSFFQAIPLFILMLPVSLFVVGTAFVFHELGHRNVARHFNYVAEFRKWNQGLMIALGFAFLIGAIFAAPGAVYIGGKKKKKWDDQTKWDQDYPEYAGNSMNELGLISVAGVIINIILGFIFLGLLFFVVPLINSFQFILSLVFTLGYTINFVLAGFNLIPFGPLDGKKVMQWNPIIWAVLFFPILFWYLYFF
ncbi:site-2 protease family protein [Candidatus Micrarchaeota archaeon]|nr:site-2 protease family protein [Candidatus Micrarchaeota archaeon]MBU2476187.1 site-2 protease family protein [Candidatus Micrarchaeota archaeon]